ncbi:uncharacterized protein LOC123556090 [Mercenaria mercenaria]|uniref:uncharacterized protein LOC123556090 n=1 Tax=Mercenaria mercenaria TaxID=6596 RepID=UPI00234F6CB1|nr:uncharacterized protein LOC123556090 [Mercenaria mercenaria]
MCSNVPGRVAPATCEPCKLNSASTVATVFCATCDEFQCNEAHEIYTGMKNHELMKASESRRHLVGLKLCDEHKNDLRFFCEVDNKLCCGMCAFTEHRTCKNVAEIGTYARLLSHDTDTLIDAMCNFFQSTVTSYRSILEKKTKDLLYHVERIPECIDALQANINENLDDILQNVVKEANGVMEKKGMTITERKRKCKMLYSEIQDLLINIDQIIERGTSDQKFITQHKLVEIYEGYLEKVKYLASSIDSLDFKLDLEIGTSKKYLGHLYTFITKEMMTNEEELQGTAIENVASRDLKKSEDDVTVSFYLGIDFLLDGRLIAADNKNKRIRNLYSSIKSSK